MSVTKRLLASSAAWYNLRRSPDWNRGSRRDPARLGRAEFTLPAVAMTPVEQLTTAMEDLAFEVHMLLSDRSHPDKQGQCGLDTRSSVFTDQLSR